MNFPINESVVNRLYFYPNVILNNQTDETTRRFEMVEENKTNIISQEDYRMHYVFFDALVFVLDDFLQIYKLGEGSPKYYDLYASISCKENWPNIIDVLEVNSVHIVRLVYDRGNNEEFSLNYYFNFSNIDMKVIIDQGKLYEFIAWMESYYLYFSEVDLNIKDSKDVDRLLNLSVKESIEKTFSEKATEKLNIHTR